MGVEQSNQPQARGCPFPHNERESAPEAAERLAGCPAHAHSGGTAGPAAAPHGGAAAAPAAPAAGGNDGLQAQPQEQQQRPAQPQPAEHTLPQAEAEAEPMKCPLGFGAGNTSRLDPLNCVLCRSLYHEAAVTACGHRFCAVCIGPFRDCPLCGADCKPLSEDAQMQETVDKYIDVHSRDHQLTSRGEAAPQEKEAVVQHPAAAQAAFYLQIGLRSFSGGNLAAALSRLQACEAALLEQQRAESSSDALATQLGAVCGSQADALRRLNQLEQATSKYEEAVRHLESCAEPRDETQHALSVSLNKLGDLQYLGNDLPAARQLYVKALDIRREACSSMGGSASQQVDLAASMVKVADVSGALGDVEMLTALRNEAAVLARAVAKEDLDDAGRAKLGGLRAYFAAQQQPGQAV